MVAGVIQGYWDLVQARTERWVVEQQILQAEAANEQERLEMEEGLANSGELAQTAATLANFRANLVTAEATVLNRVASLRAIMGVPPGSDFTIVPITTPVSERVEFEWNGLVRLAELHRPDLVELKIILEADLQRLLVAHNRAQAQLDAVALYRWNGLEGKMPIGDRIASEAGQHTDWSLAVNFSVPLTLRADRANLRQTELLIANDRANLQQGLLGASHSLAAVVRNLDQLNEQYAAFKRARAAARESLNLQFARFQIGQANFVEVLLAINTWASAVTSEARAITELNGTLAVLEVETGTILETHGVRLFEERYCALGPLGKHGATRQYPKAIRPSQNIDKYPTGSEPSEEAFNLEVPVDRELTEELNYRPQRLPMDIDSP